MINDTEFIKNFVLTQINGKKEALHAYDKMMWVVRSGYLTLVFAGWGLIIQEAAGNKIPLIDIFPYFIALSLLSLVLAYAGFNIDIAYAQRKFRVIFSLNQLIEIITTSRFENADTKLLNSLAEMLQISGERKNDNHLKVEGYKNELKLVRLIYLTPSILIAGIVIYCMIRF